MSQQWEYKKTSFDRNHPQIHEAFNIQGQDGWGICGMLDSSGGCGLMEVWFKRIKKPQVFLTDM